MKILQKKDLYVGQYNMIDGLVVTTLKQIFHPSGSVYHGIKRSDPGFMGFEEAYFSTIKFTEIKAWKKHTKMTLNLMVPVGEIRFVIYDDRDDSRTKGGYLEIILSLDNYRRITIPPGVWVGFQGVGEDLNLLLNVANMEHDPTEITRLKKDEIEYNWIL